MKEQKNKEDMLGREWRESWSGDVRRARREGAKGWKKEGAVCGVMQSAARALGPRMRGTRSEAQVPHIVGVPASIPGSFFGLRGMPRYQQKPSCPGRGEALPPFLFPFPSAVR